MLKKFTKQSYASFSFFSAVFVGIFALILPPLGIIDDSVLWFTAQLLLFTSSILGINFEIPFANKK